MPPSSATHCTAPAVSSELQGGVWGEQPICTDPVPPALLSQATDGHLALPKQCLDLESSLVWFFGFLLRCAFLNVGVGLATGQRELRGFLTNSIWGWDGKHVFLLHCCNALFCLLFGKQQGLSFPQLCE